MHLRKKTIPSSASTFRSADGSARASVANPAPKEPAATRQGLSAADLIAMARSARRQATQA
jgi:hypothetical protein